MTAKDLKASILQLAIQGKLVPQDPTDEPASVLLARVRGEGEVVRQETGDASGDQKTKRPHVSRLTSSSPRVSRLKSRDLPPITDDEKPFDLPEGWAWCRLGEMFSFIDYRGMTPTKISSGVPLVTAKNVRPGYMDYSVKEYISEAEFSRRQTRGIAKKGDLLFTTEAPMGFVAVADLPVFSTGQRLITFQQRTTEDQFDNTLVMYFLLSPWWQAYLAENKTGTTVAGIKGKTLMGLLVPLPPLAEQKRIVAKIEELMPMVERYGAVKEQSDALEAALPDAFRKSVLQYAIQGKLVPQDPNDEPASALLARVRGEGEVVRQETGDASGDQKTKRPHVSRLASSSSRVSRLKSHVLPPVTDDEKPFDLPDGWAWCRVGEIAEVQLGKMLDKDRQVGARYSYLANLNVRWHSFDLSELRSTYFSDEEAKKFTLCKGDILMCEGGVPGRCAIWQEESTSIKYQKALHRLRVKNVLPEYVVFFFEAICDSVNFKEVFTGTTIKHLPRERLISLLFPLPPLAEQKRIVTEVERLLALGEHLKVAS